MKHFLKKYKTLLILIIGWLIIINLFAFIALNRFDLEKDTAYKWIITNPAQNSWDIIDLHSRWDSNGYIEIAKNGYTQEKQNLGAMFPAYPFLIKIVAFIFGDDYILSGWLISMIFLILSCFTLFKLVEKFHPKIDPLLAVFLFLIFPTAFFLNAVYAESLFLFLSLLCFYKIRKKQFYLAALFGLLASLTRVIGVVLIIPLVIEYFKIYPVSPLLKNKLRVLIASSIILLGPIGLFTFYKIYYGSFFHFFNMTADWGRQFAFNEGHFVLNTNPAIAHFILDISLPFICLIASLAIINKIRKSYGYYSLAMLLIPISTGTLMSINRYIIMIFPLFILGASIKTPVYRYLWIMLSTLLLSLYIILFVNSYWAG